MLFFAIDHCQVRKVSGVRHVGSLPVVGLPDGCKRDPINTEKMAYLALSQRSKTEVLESLIHELWKRTEQSRRLVHC